MVEIFVIVDFRSFQEERELSRDVSKLHIRYSVNFKEYHHGDVEQYTRSPFQGEKLCRRTRVYSRCSSSYSAAI